MPSRGLSSEYPSPRPACLVAVPILSAIYPGLGSLIVAGARGRGAGFSGGRRPQELRHIRGALAAAGYRPVVTGDTEEALRRREVSEPAEPYVLGDLTVDFASAG